jgi:hypothetical protein
MGHFCHDGGPQLRPRFRLLQEQRIREVSEEHDEVSGETHQGFQPRKVWYGPKYQLEMGKSHLWDILATSCGHLLVITGYFYGIMMEYAFHKWG